MSNQPMYTTNHTHDSHLPTFSKASKETTSSKLLFYYCFLVFHHQPIMPFRRNRYQKFYYSKERYQIHLRGEINHSAIQQTLIITMRQQMSLKARVDLIRFNRIESNRSKLHNHVYLNIYTEPTGVMPSPTIYCCEALYKRPGNSCILSLSNGCAYWP